MRSFGDRPFRMRFLVLGGLLALAACGSPSNSAGAGGLDSLPGGSAVTPTAPDGSEGTPGQADPPPSGSQPSDARPQDAQPQDAQSPDAQSPDVQPPVAQPPGPLPPIAPPAGLVPADHDRMVGRWAPAGESTAPQPPHARFERSGDWTGSDGCNRAAGRWSIAADGTLTVTSGPMTLIGCAGQVDVPGWVGRAARAGFDGGTLVLLAADGQELGRLVRA